MPSARVAATLALNYSITGLVLAHTVLPIPFVVITVSVLMLVAVQVFGRGRST